MRMSATVGWTEAGIYQVDVEVDGESPPETRVTTAEDGGVQVETVHEPNLLLDVAMWVPTLIILLLIAAVGVAITSKER